MAKSKGKAKSKPKEPAVQQPPAPEAPAPKAEEPAPPPPAPPKERAAKKFVVPTGMSIICRRGVLEAGTEVTEKDFAGGRATIDDLLKRKRLVVR